MNIILNEYIFKILINFRNFRYLGIGIGTWNKYACHVE